MSLVSKVDREEVGLLEYTELVSSGVKPFDGLRKYVDTGSVETGRILDGVDVDFESRPSRANMEAEVDDVLFSKMKATEKVYLVQKGDDNKIYSTGLSFLRTKNKSMILPRFLFYWLRSKQFQRWKDKESSGATQKAISEGKLKRATISLPPLVVQEEVATTLEKLDRAESLRKEGNRLTASFQESIFSHMFGNPFKNPLKWPVHILEELCEDIVDCPHSTPHYSEEVTPFACIRTSELKDGYIDWSTMKYLTEKRHKERVRRLVPAEGDVIYGREGTFGEAAVVPENVNLSLGQRVMMFRPNHELCTPEFLWAMVRSKFVYSQALRTTSGSTVGHVNVKDIIRFKVLCPPLKLQQTFSSITKSVQAVRDSQNGILSNIERLRALLMQDVFRRKMTC